MSNWEVAMAGEQEGRKLWDEGDHRLIVKEVRLIGSEESGSGNPYFLWNFADEKSGDPIEVITTLIKGKRWLLKQLLFACGIEAKTNDPEEKYSFNPDMVLGKKVLGTIKNKENKYTARNGNEVVGTKSEIVKFQKVEDDPDSIPF